MMATYEYREDSGYNEEIEASSLGEACERGREILAGGNWGDEGGWVTATVVELDEDGDVVDSRGIKMLLEPPEPECEHEDGHDWRRQLCGCDENPGVYGIGGAAIAIGDVCLHCGLVRQTITGDTDHPNSGNRDGVTYRDYYDDEALGAVREHYGYEADDED